MKSVKQQFEFYKKYIAFGNRADFFKTNKNNLQLKFYRTYN